MIQTYNDIAEQIKNFAEHLNSGARIQKIYGSSRYISISVRSGGCTYYLFLGRGKTYEGFWVGESQIESQLRKKDRLLEYLRKNMQNTILKSIRVDSLDRIIFFDTAKKGADLRFGFFYKARVLYFAAKIYDEKKRTYRVFTTWRGILEENLELEKVFDEVGRMGQEKKRKSKNIPGIDILLEQELKSAIKAKDQPRKKKSFRERKIKNIMMDIENAQRWRGLEQWLNEQENLEIHPKKIQPEGVKINFHEKSHFKRRDEIYRKIKRLKTGARILTERLNEVKAQEVPEVESTDLRKIDNGLDVIEPMWKMFSADVDVASVKNTDGGYEVHKYQGYKLGIGLTAQGNDELRKSWASKDDIWLHTEAGTSPHVIFKGELLNAPTQEVFYEVSKLLKAKLRSDSSEFDLIYTQVKNLKGVKGQPGMVNFKKEKRVKVIL